MNAQKQLKILLVDDEASIHQSIGEYLVQCGHDVEGARDGKAGLKCIEQGEYDLRSSISKCPEWMV